MNKVILMGRLTRDPEMRQTPSGVSLCGFSIAVNRRFAKEGQQTADFINCTAWRQTAEFICKYFHKGSMIAVVGNLQSRSWENQEGKKQYATDVVVDEAYFTGSKTESGTIGEHGEYSSPQPKSNNGFGDIDNMGFQAIDGSEDDLPF
ncbi:MAG: single-stranded DNA-binding protein [Firmicutes bacterium]|nr:single-stranded DNA-binding protein [Bacillota bacterium]